MVRLRDLGDWTGGNTPSKSNAGYWTNGTVPWVSPKDMKVDEITASEDRITETALNEGRVSLVPEGSVLFVTRSGILAHTLPVAVTKLPVTINQDLKALTPRAGVFPKYVAHAVRGASRRILNECSKHGTTVASIETNALLNFEIPLVDLGEQHRIVAEIEKQFSRLDEAVENLKRVVANLKRYRAAVLKAAVEGRLVPTEAELASREGRGYESGPDLLHRILELRRQSWKGRSKYLEPAQPETTNSESLPEGWVYASAEQITEQDRPITYGVIKLGENVEGGIPILRSSDVRRLKLDLQRVKSISPRIAAKFRRTFLCGGEIVVTVRGTLGGIAVVPQSCAGFNISREVAMLALVLPEMANAVASFIGSAPIEGWLLSRTKGIAYTGINIETLRALPIPVPPLAEQVRIVAELERRMSFLNSVETEIDVGLQRARALRESALSAAFEISEAIV